MKTVHTKYASFSLVRDALLESRHYSFGTLVHPYMSCRIFVEKNKFQNATGARVASICQFCPEQQRIRLLLSTRRKVA